MQSSLGMWREVATQRFQSIAVIWWENTTLCVMLDVEVKQQLLNKGSKEKDVHLGHRLWALSKQGGLSSELSFRKGKRVRCHRRYVSSLPAAVPWRQQCSLYQDRASV